MSDSGSGPRRSASPQPRFVFPAITQDDPRNHAKWHETRPLRVISRIVFHYTDYGGFPEDTAADPDLALLDLSFPVGELCDNVSQVKEKTRPRTVMKRQTF
jgi:hypothetical protein